ncbi:MAG: S-layer homology domain-containing protein, partial [Clostridia bacterium]|nr:S-layer homology domain-containing protein [Clostridia bacterium]
GLVPMQAFADSTSYVTREQAVAGIIQTVGLGALNETESDLSAFKDASLVTPDNKDELAVALTNGILTGYGNGTISPSKNVTRLEFALFLSRTIRELPAINMVTAFKDVPAAYQGDVAKIAKAGLMGGYGNEKFGSGDYMTAQQMAAVLGRVKALASVRPQDDFFYAMNRNWLATTKLPAGYPGLSAFDEADRSNSDKLKLMVQELYKNKGTYAEGTKEQKMSDFYTTILDTDSRNKEGIQPIKKYMDLIESAKTCQELLKVMVQFENETGMNMLFTFGPSPDMKDSSKYCLYAGGLSTGLPSSYLLAGNAQIDSLYTGFMAQLLALSGLGEADAAKKAQTVFAFEKELAKSTMTNEQASKVENLYNPTSVEDLIKMFPKVSLKDYLNDLGYGKQTTAIVTDISLMKKTGEVMNDENLDTLKAYARVHLIMNTGSLLSKDFQDAITAFNST